MQKKGENSTSMSYRKGQCLNASCIQFYKNQFSKIKVNLLSVRLVWFFFMQVSEGSVIKSLHI